MYFNRGARGWIEGNVIDDSPVVMIYIVALFFLSLRYIYRYTLSFLLFFCLRCVYISLFNARRVHGSLHKVQSIFSRNNNDDDGDDDDDDNDDDDDDNNDGYFYKVVSSGDFQCTVYEFVQFCRVKFDDFRVG